MRVDLKGIHTVTATLAGGGKRTYHYAWRGGPRLKGEPGSAAFVTSYEQAHRNVANPAPDQLRKIVADYKASQDFKGLRERTRADYLKFLGMIETKFGDLPIAALDDPRVTQDFLEWRDGLASSPRQADYALTVLWLLLNWARGRGITAYRPPERVKKLYKADRAELIWEPEDIEAFMAVAPEPLQRAMVLAMDTGQRQGDLLAASWTTYNGERIKLRQSKTGRVVRIPATEDLKATLDGMPRIATTILTDSRGRPWKANSFRRAWRLATRKAGIEKRTFNDVRGTAVTRLSELGSPPQEIATITGHTFKSVEAILEHYSARTYNLALSAIARLNRSRS